MALEAPSDDEDTTVTPQRVIKYPKNASFDLDDAFSLSDGDDDHYPAFALSSASIRADLARNQFGLHETEDENEVDREDVVTPVSNGRSEHSLKDTSVSTIDIGGPALGFPPSPVQSTLSQTPEESEHSNEFSQVSLSDDSIPEHEDSPHEDSEQEHEENIRDGGENLPYPTVHIDVSQPPSSRVELADAQLDPPRAHDQDKNQDHPREPHPPNSAPASSYTQSFHLTSSSPSPSPTLTTPTNSNPTPNPTNPKFNPGHRPTRSTGPSALEKVVSKTRPAYLPPKTKQEDNKHMADWEHMMKLSRSAGEFLLLASVVWCLL